MSLSFLDDIPMATVIAIAGIIGSIIALIAGDIDFDNFMLAIGATTAGAGVLGVARNQAGKGLRQTKNYDSPVTRDALSAEPRPSGTTYERP